MIIDDDEDDNDDNDDDNSKMFRLGTTWARKVPLGIVPNVLIHSAGSLETAEQLQVDGQASKPTLESFAPPVSLGCKITEQVQILTAFGIPMIPDAHDTCPARHSPESAAFAPICCGRCPLRGQAC